MDKSVKLAQQVLNRMVVFPASPLTVFPLASRRVAVTVMVVTPTETQLPCEQHSKYLALPLHPSLNILDISSQIFKSKANVSTMGSLHHPLLLLLLMNTLMNNTYPFPRAL